MPYTKRDLEKKGVNKKSVSSSLTGKSPFRQSLGKNSSGSKKMYTSGEYKDALNKVGVPQARKKLSKHYGMTVTEYKKYMDGYSSTSVKGKKTQNIGKTAGEKSAHNASPFRQSVSASKGKKRKKATPK